MHDLELTRYRKYSLTEAVRLYELSNGYLDDASAIALAQNGAPDIESRLVTRALHLVRQNGLIAATSVSGARPLISPGLLVLMFSAVLGFLIGRSISAGAPGLINAVGWVGGLLLVQMLGLSAWLMSFGFGLETRRSLFPWIREAVEHLFQGKGFELSHLQARQILDRKNNLARWRVGLIVHGAWVAVFVALLLTVFLILVLKRFDFVVESTILDDRYFASVVRGLGALPSYIGFSVPSDTDIRDALLGIPGDQYARRAWGWWIIGVLAIWALLPRVLLWALCKEVVRRRENSVVLDLADPYYARLRGRLLPKRESPQVVDPDPQIGTRQPTDGKHTQMGGPPVIIGLELTKWPWFQPLPAGIMDGGVMEDLEDQHRVREMLVQARPSRLMIVCDSALSPDRGSLRLIADLAPRAAQVAVLLVSARDQMDENRTDLWKGELTHYSVEEGNVFTHPEEALRWLQIH